MLKKIIIFICFAAILFIFIINSPIIKPASIIKIVSSIENESIKVFDSSVDITNLFYWNRLNKITRVSPGYKLSSIEQENSTYFMGKDFFMSREEDGIYIYDKKQERKNYLGDSSLILSNKDSNLFALVKKNGMEIGFYQFIPLENKGVLLKNEIFPSLYTSYCITRNGFYFALMNGYIYYFNPFENISSERAVSESSDIIYGVSSNSVTSDYAIISGYNPQKLSIFNIDGTILLEKNITTTKNTFIYMLENQMILYKEKSKIIVGRYNQKKSTSFEEYASLNIEGQLLDCIEFYSYFVCIISDGNRYSIVVYRYDDNRFYKKDWKYPIYQIDILDTTGVFAVYNENNLWIFDLQKENIR